MVPAGVRRLLGWLVLAIGVLVAIEGALRFQHGHPTGGTPIADVPAGMFVGDPAAGFALAPRFASPELGLTVNDTGLRDVARPAVSGAHWLVLGDEIAAGLGVEDDEHLARLIELGLSTSDDPAPAVWNGAVPRYGPEQALMRYRTLMAAHRLDPRVVILVVHLGNDARDAARGPGVERVVGDRLVEVPWGPWPGSPFNQERGDGLFLSRWLGRGVRDAPQPIDLYLQPANEATERGWAVTAEAIGQLEQLFDALDKQIRVGWFDLPSAVEAP